MSIVLVSDVFGLTPALLEIAKNLDACLIIDPYNGQTMEFENESTAYSYFVQNIGLDSYFSFLSKAVARIEKPVTLIGFSVGASVVWRLSEIKGNKFIKQAFCYYGSQIRNFTEIEPSFKVNLVFPSSERHFDVAELQRRISKKSNVEAYKVNYLHGFMNYNSNNYSEAGYTAHMRLLHSINSLQEN